MRVVVEGEVVGLRLRLRRPRLELTWTASGREGKRGGARREGRVTIMMLLCRSVHVAVVCIIMLMVLCEWDGVIGLDWDGLGSGLLAKSFNGPISTRVEAKPSQAK